MYDPEKPDKVINMTLKMYKDDLFENMTYYDFDTYDENGGTVWGISAHHPNQVIDFFNEMINKEDI